MYEYTQDIAIPCILFYFAAMFYLKIGKLAASFRILKTSNRIVRKRQNRNGIVEPKVEEPVRKRPIERVKRKKRESIILPKSQKGFINYDVPAFIRQKIEIPELGFVADEMGNIIRKSIVGETTDLKPQLVEAVDVAAGDFGAVLGE